ncbi:MAG: glycosyltransferase [Lachnospiraceae bacterium]|nr:glycosyltransferase [Lachnospiraceae bacterium]
MHTEDRAEDNKAAVRADEAEGRGQEAGAAGMTAGSTAAAAHVPHLVLYIGSLQKGGAERVLGNLAEYFFTLGWRVTFVTTYCHPPEYALPHAGWDADGKPSYDPVHASFEEARAKGIGRVYSDPDAGLLTGSRVHNFVVRYRVLRNIFKTLHPDLVLSFSGKNNLMAIAATRGLVRTDLQGRRRQVPCAVSVRGMPAREYAGRAMTLCAKALFPLAEGVILQSKGAAEWFPARIRKRAVILPNSINPAFIRPVYQGEREKRVVLVGRLDANKNEGMAVRAFAKTRSRHPEYICDIYGDGPSRKEFEALAAQLHVSDAVRFHGAVSDVPERIEHAAVYVLTSKAEGMPNALIEAMGLGLAPISTDCPSYGPRGLIRDGENGYLVPVDDVDAMADRLLRLMDDENLRREMGRRASAVQEEYAPSRINPMWKEYLLGLMN